MSEFAQVTLSGLFIGFGYAGLGAGLSLTWSATGAINVAHAAFAVLAAYIGYLAHRDLGIDPLLALLALLPAFFVAGLVFNALLLRPLKRRARDVAMASIVLTFGVAVVLEHVMAELFSSDPRLVGTGYARSALELAGVDVPAGQAVAMLLSTAVLATLWWLLHRTRVGRQIRAIEQDGDGALACGIDVERRRALACGLAFASAAAAGIALSLIYTFHPGSYLPWLISAFVAVVLGGVGSMAGLVLAGLLVGLLSTVPTLWVPFSWVTLIVFAVLVLTLGLRPHGLEAR